MKKSNGSDIGFSVPNTDRAIAAATRTSWTPANAESFGTAASPRTTRRWRAERGVAGRRAMADMADAPRPRRPDPRHAMLATVALRFMQNRTATLRQVHALHVRQIERANLAAACGATRLSAPSHSSVCRWAAATAAGAAAGREGAK